MLRNMQYTLIESLEREVFDKRYTVYLYVASLHTELDRLSFLASYNGTYIMTVNADYTFTDFTSFKQVLFYTGTFLIMERRFCNTEYIGVKCRIGYESCPFD